MTNLSYESGKSARQFQGKCVRFITDTNSGLKIFILSVHIKCLSIYIGGFFHLCRSVILPNVLFIKMFVIKMVSLVALVLGSGVLLSI